MNLNSGNLRYRGPSGVWTVVLTVILVEIVGFARFMLSSRCTMSGYIAPVKWFRATFDVPGAAGDERPAAICL